MFDAQEYIRVAEGPSEHVEAFPFHGLSESGYQTLKAESEEFPVYATPIDQLIERFRTEGIKIVVDNGRVFVLPIESVDIENDSVFPRFLEVSSDMDPDLRRLKKTGEITGVTRKNNYSI